MPRRDKDTQPASPSFFSKSVPSRFSGSRAREASKQARRHCHQLVHRRPRSERSDREATLGRLTNVICNNSLGLEGGRVCLDVPPTMYGSRLPLAGTGWTSTVTPYRRVSALGSSGREPAAPPARASVQIPERFRAGGLISQAVPRRALSAPPLAPLTDASGAWTPTRAVARGLLPVAAATWPVRGPWPHGTLLRAQMSPRARPSSLACAHLASAGTGRYTPSMKST